MLAKSTGIQQNWVYSIYSLQNGNLNLKQKYSYNLQLPVRETHYSYLVRSSKSARACFSSREGRLQLLLKKHLAMIIIKYIFRENQSDLHLNSTVHSFKVVKMPL